MKKQKNIAGTYKGKYRIQNRISEKQHCNSRKNCGKYKNKSTTQSIPKILVLIQLHCIEEKLGFSKSESHFCTIYAISYKFELANALLRSKANRKDMK